MNSSSVQFFSKVSVTGGGVGGAGGTLLLAFQVPETV